MLRSIRMQRAARREAGAGTDARIAWPLAIYFGACAATTPSIGTAPTTGPSPVGPIPTAPIRAGPVAVVARVWAIALDGPDGLADFGPRNEGRFGLDRLHLDRASTGASGSPTTFLRADYPRGSASPAVGVATGAPGGGAQFLGTRPGTPADHLFLRYRVRFAENFAFVKGGKLPGFYGGHMISGGRIPDGADGFSTRLMWRTGGAGEVYAYLPSSETWGTSLGRGSFRFTTGRWQCLEQELSLDTPGRADGVVRVWLDDRPVFEREHLTFRTTAALRIEGIFFSTFFGGNDASWASPVDTHADFADFAVAERRIGCGG